MKKVKEPKPAIKIVVDWLYKDNHDLKTNFRVRHSHKVLMIERLSKK